MTLFTSYFLFGDYNYNDFKKATFILLRLLGSVFRGTIENNDFENENNETNFEKLY